MKRTVVAAGVAAVLSVGLFAAPAMATEVSEECESARAALEDAPVMVDNPALVDLQAAVTAAVEAELLSPVNPGDVERLEELKTMAADDEHPNQKLAAEKVALIEAHLAAIAEAEAVLAAAPVEVANPALGGLTAARDAACEQNTAPEPNDPNEPTNGSDNDGDQSRGNSSDINGLTGGPVRGTDPVNTGVVTSVPVGSVDTGA